MRLGAEVIDHLLAAPDAPETLALVRPNVYYEFADPALQSLSSGQKILLRVGSNEWPEGLLHVPLGTFNTLVLIASSITVVMAWASLMRNDLGKYRLFLGLTVAVVAAIVVLSGARKSGKATEVRLEAVGKRDLVSVVTASGKIEAETKVGAEKGKHDENISFDELAARVGSGIVRLDSAANDVTTLAASHTGSISYTDTTGDGPRSTPTWDEGRVYALGATGERVRVSLAGSLGADLDGKPLDRAFHLQIY